MGCQALLLDIRALKRGREVCRRTLYNLYVVLWFIFILYRITSLKHEIVYFPALYLVYSFLDRFHVHMSKALLTQCIIVNLMRAIDFCCSKIFLLTNRLYIRQTLSFKTWSSNSAFTSGGRLWLGPWRWGVPPDWECQRPGQELGLDLPDPGTDCRGQRLASLLLDARWSYLLLEGELDCGGRV